MDALDSALQALLRDAGRAYVANVEAELERVLKGLEPTLLEAGVSVTVNVSGLRGVRAWVSPTDLQFLLMNIVSNSLRAMAEADTRRLVVGAEPSGGFATLTFTDTGRGMSPEERENAFALGGTSKPEGGGTGLYRSREALAPLGGSIEIAESGPGSGTTIVVRLRLAPMFAEPRDARPSTRN